MVQDVRIGNSAMQIAAALLEEDRRRNAEIAVLEWDLQETRRRHVEELTRFPVRDLGSVPVPASASARLAGRHVNPHTGKEASANTWPICPPPSHVAAGSPTGAVRARAAQATPREPGLSTGPTLATRRRHIKDRRFQLWVEDRLTSQAARIHAMDEDGSWRTHLDVPDNSLSSMLEDFRSCRERPLDVDDQADVDDFLHALLDGVNLIEAPGSGTDLQLSLPRHVDGPRSARATSKRAVGGAGPIGKSDQDQASHGAGSASSCCGGSPLHNRTMLPAQVPIEEAARPPPDRPRGCVALNLFLPAAPQRPLNARPVQTSRGTPCLLPGGPGKCASGDAACLLRADRDKANLIVARPREGEVATTAARHPGQTSRGRLCTSQASTSSRSSNCRVIARPQSAPNRAKRPQTGHRFVRDRDRTMKVASPAPAESPRVSPSRRVRPISAKAFKHRRVWDDGDDCIIYEDVAGENEEDELGENHVATWAASKRGSTGGCGSRTPSAHGSVSSRSQSQQPSVHTCGTITSRPSSAASDYIVFEDTMRIDYISDEETPGASAAGEGHCQADDGLFRAAAAMAEEVLCRAKQMTASALAEQPNTATAVASSSSSGKQKQKHKQMLEVEANETTA